MTSNNDKLFDNYLTTYIKEKKDINQIYNINSEFVIQSKQLIVYFNFRRKFNEILSNEKSFNNNKYLNNNYFQNKYCLIDGNWLENWKKHVGYDEIIKTYHSKLLDRDLNEKDYIWIKPIIKQNSGNNLLGLLNNEVIFNNDYNVDPLVDFDIIDDVCYKYFTPKNNEYFFNKKTLIPRHYPIKLLNGKIILMLDLYNYLLRFKDNNSNQYFELLIKFHERSKGRKMTIDFIEKQDINDCIKSLNFNLNKDQNKKFNLFYSNFEIINKTLLLKNKKLHINQVNPNLKDEIKNFYSNNINNLKKNKKINSKYLINDKKNDINDDLKNNYISKKSDNNNKKNVNNQSKKNIIIQNNSPIKQPKDFNKGFQESDNNYNENIKINLEPLLNDEKRKNEYERTIKELNDKLDQTVSYYEKEIKEKTTIITNNEKIIKELKDNLNKTVAQYEKSIINLNEKHKININEHEKNIKELNDKILQLNKELRDEKNKNNILSNKIKELEDTILKEKIITDELKEKNNLMKKIIEEDSDKNKIIKLMEELKEKGNELNELKKRYPVELLPGEKLLSVIFISSDQTIHYSIICKNTDKFFKLEDLLYEEYPEYSDSKNIFLFKGNKINEYKSLEYNKIKNGDIITLKNMDDEL